MSNEAGFPHGSVGSDVSAMLAFDSLVSAGELAVRERVRDFTQQRIRPGIAGWYDDGVFPLELAPELGDSSLQAAMLVVIPAAGIWSALHFFLAAKSLHQSASQTT